MELPKSKRGKLNEKSRKTDETGNEKNAGSIVDFEYLFQYNEYESNGAGRAGSNPNGSG